MDHLLVPHLSILSYLIISIDILVYHALPYTSAPKKNVLSYFPGLFQHYSLLQLLREGSILATDKSRLSKLSFHEDRRNVFAL